jgi:pimeloyl-ACP methyl ester carboxylesterase
MSGDGPNERSEPRDLVVAAEAPIAVHDHGGDGADVLLLHGGGRSMDDWRRVIPLLLDAGLRVTAMDLRGHGRSGRAPWRWPAVLEDVQAVIDHLRLVRPAIVGHSLGGMVAALWASTHADCPLAVNTDGHGFPRGPDQYAGLVPEAAAAAHDTIGRFRAEGLGPRVDPYVAHLIAAVDELDLFPVYRATRCPLLVVSARSPNLPKLLPAPVAEALSAYLLWVADELASVAADTPLVSVATLSGSHDLHLEVPRELTDLVLRRLGRT